MNSHKRENKLGRSNVNNRRKQQTITTECINADAKHDITINEKSFFSKHWKTPKIVRLILFLHFALNFVIIERHTH